MCLSTCLWQRSHLLHCFFCQVDGCVVVPAPEQNPSNLAVRIRGLLGGAIIDIVVGNVCRSILEQAKLAYENLAMAQCHQMIFIFCHELDVGDCSNGRNIFIKVFRHRDEEGLGRPSL
jgi:hypothetical protein